MQTASTTDVPRQQYDPFPAFKHAVVSHATVVMARNDPLFATEATDLFETFLSHLPAEIRQVYTCHACRDFFERYGGLVSIAQDGRSTPVFWHAESAPAPFVNAVQAMEAVVQHGTIRGVHLSPEAIWGTPTSAPTPAGHVWAHLAVEQPASRRYRATVLKTALQAMAEKQGDYGMLCRSLAAYSPPPGTAPVCPECQLTDAEGDWPTCPSSGCPMQQAVAQAQDERDASPSGPCRHFLTLASGRCLAGVRYLDVVGESLPGLLLLPCVPAGVHLPCAQRQWP